MTPGRFSQATLQKMSAFRDDPQAIAIVFKGAPLGAVPEASDALNSSSLSRWVLGSATKFFGTLVGYEELKSQALFKNIYTGGSASDTSYIGNYTEEASDRYFGWHVENGAHPHMPRYVLMLCLRQDDQRITETLFLPGQSVVSKLSPQSLAVLKQKRFTLDVEDTLNLDNVSSIPEPIPVLSEQIGGGAWRINLDSTFMHPTQQDDSTARAAFDELLAVAESSFESVKLEAGDLIVWDNTRAAHDRQFSGTNRWLQRTHACTGKASPFHMFHDIPVGYMRSGDPCVLQTSGVFKEAYARRSHGEL